MPSTPTRESPNDPSVWRATRISRLSVVHTTNDVLIFELDDGRTVTAPIVWYPRLAYATAAERERVEIIGGDTAYWPRLDEGIRVEHVLTGGPSPEKAESLRRWQEEMNRRRRERALDEPWGKGRPLPDGWEEDDE